MKRMKHLSIKISGKVQGVFFRVSTKEFVDKIGITGWVKNESNGTVSIQAEGNVESLEQLLLWCQKGSNGAKIENVEHKWDNELKRYRNFEIKY